MRICPYCAPLFAYAPYNILPSISAAFDTYVLSLVTDSQEVWTAKEDPQGDM